MTACFREPRHPCIIPNCRPQCPTLISINMLDLNIIWTEFRHHRCLICLLRSIPVMKNTITPCIIKMLGTIKIFLVAFTLISNNVTFYEIRGFIFSESILILMRLDFWLQVTAGAIRRDRVLEANSSRKSCLYRLDGRLTLHSVAGSITSIIIPKLRIGRIRSRKRVYPQDGRESSRLNMGFIMSSELSYEKKRRQFSHNHAHYNNYFFFLTLQSHHASSAIRTSVLSARNASGARCVTTAAHTLSLSQRPRAG